MLILFNGEILTKVSLFHNLENSVSFLDYLGWRYYKTEKSNGSKPIRIPCITFPNLIQDGIWKNCEIGFIDSVSMRFTTSEICLEHIKIKRIEVCKYSGKRDIPTRDGWYSNQEYTEYFYKIELSFFDIDNKGEVMPYQPTYTFQSYDVIWANFREDHCFTKKYSRTFQYLFCDFPRIIKDYLEGNEHDHYFYKRPLCLLNFDILQKEWPKKEMYDYEVFSCVTASHEVLFDRNDRMNLPYTFEKVIISLLSIEVEKNEDGIVVKFGNGNKDYLNIYIERFFEFAFDQQLLYDRNTKIAYCKFNKTPPFELSTNEDIAAYIACVMHLYLYKYFDLEANRELYLVNIPQDLSEYNEISTYLTSMDKIELEEQFYDIYRLIFCCNIEHKQQGYNRVGRDDCESQFKTYEFRPREGHLVSKSVIHKIDMLLQTKLKYEDKKTGWDPHPERYYYYNEYSHEYFYCRAESKDLGSVELKNASFLFISNYFIKEYLIDRDDFKRFLE